MSVVYRVENESGYGAYHADFAKAYEQHDPDRTPGPHNDGIGEPRLCHFFGFATVQQMLAWWNVHELLDLYESGCRVVKYEVDEEHIVRGYRQVTFNKSEAQRWWAFSL